MMWANGWPFQHTHEYVKSIRASCSPNSGFITQLIRWWKRLHEPKRVTRLYRIASQSAYETSYLVPKHVEAVSFTSLDPRNCFVLHSMERLFLWKGSRSEERSVSAARKSIDQLRRYERSEHQVAVEVREGEETAEFWEQLGGKGKVEQVPKYDAEFSYVQVDISQLFVESQVPPTAPSIRPSLFQMKCQHHSQQHTSDEFEEYTMFDSDDLDEAEIYIVKPHDGTKALWVWIGEGFEKPGDFGGTLVEFGKKAGEVFIKKHQVEADVCVNVICQNQEPKEFWAYFVNG